MPAVHPPLLQTLLLTQQGYTPNCPKLIGYLYASPGRKNERFSGTTMVERLVVQLTRSHASGYYIFPWELSGVFTNGSARVTGSNAFYGKLLP